MQWRPKARSGAAGALASGPSAETLAELLDAPALVDHLLLTRVKRVAGHTDVDLEILAKGGPGSVFRATAALHGHHFILWMDVRLHVERKILE